MARFQRTPGSRPGVTVRTWTDGRGRKQLRYDAVYRAPDAQKRSRTFRRAGEAEAWLDTQRADVARGAWIDPAQARTPFRVWAGRWEATTQHLRPSSRARTGGILQRHLLPRFGGTPLAAIRMTDVRAFVSDLTASGLAPGSVRRILAVLQAMLKAAEDGGMIGRSPCAGVSIPSARRQEPRFLDAGEVERLAGAMPERYQALVLLAAYGGLRWSEVRGLRLGRIDWMRSRVTVEEALVEVSGHFHAGPTKTGPARVVTLPRFVTEALAGHVAAQREDAVSAGNQAADQGINTPGKSSEGPTKWRKKTPEKSRNNPVENSETNPPKLITPGGGELVFTDVQGGPLRHSNFRRRVWIPALERAEIAEPWPRIHDLRHTAAALAIAAGTHPKAIQERLGHASIRTTLDVYGHLFPALDEQLADRLDEVARAAAETPFHALKESGGRSVADHAENAVLPMRGQAH